MRRFPTDPWFQDFIAKINASSEYREAAASWEGDVAFLIEAEPDKGVPEEVWAWLDLWRGECQGGGEEHDPTAPAGRLEIQARHESWRGYLDGVLDQVRDVVSGR